MTRQLSDLDFNSASRILNLLDGIDPQEPATVAQLNAAVEGTAWKDAARVATQANINLSSPGATVDGITMASGNRVLVQSQTDPIENGIYNWAGAASAMVRSLDANTFDELESAVITVEEGTSAGVTYRQTAVNGTIGTDNVTWTTFGTSAPAATESVAGIAEIATQAEVDAGTDDARFITPEKLANYAGLLGKYAVAIGDGTETDYVVTHNLGSRDVAVSVVTAASPYDAVNVAWDATSVNTITVKAAAPIASNALRVVVVG